MSSFQFDRFIIADKNNISKPVNSYLYKTIEHAKAERDVYNDHSYGDSKIKPYGIFKVECLIIEEEIQ